MPARSIGLTICLCLSLTACQAPIRQISGDFRIERAKVADADYVVHLIHTVGFGSHPDDEFSRRATAMSLMKTTCPSGHIVREVIGSTKKDQKAQPDYSLYVKCR